MTVLSRVNCCIVTVLPLLARSLSLSLSFFLVVVVVVCVCVCRGVGVEVGGVSILLYNFYINCGLKIIYFFLMFFIHT